MKKSPMMEMMDMMARTYKITFSAVVILLFFILFGSTKAHALDGTFPASSNNPDGVTLTGMVSDAGPGVTLNAREARFKIFLPANFPDSHVDIQIRGACQTNYYNDVGPNTDIRVEIGGADGADARTNSSSACSGDHMYFKVPVSSFGSIDNSGKGVYGSFRHKLIKVNKINGTGIKSFKISASSLAYVTFDEDIYAPNAELGGDPFSIWNADKDDPIHKESRIEFQFRPTPCNYNPREDVWLNWQDADWGAPNELNGIGFELYDLTEGRRVNFKQGDPNNNNRVENAELKGDGEYHDANAGYLEWYHVYEWRWYGVDKINGIQIFMPFSEISVKAECDPDKPPAPPPGVPEPCKRFTRKLQPHSIYRIAYYPKGYGITSPTNKGAPSTSPRNSLDSTKWNDYGGGIVYDDRDISNSSGSEENYSRDYPNPMGQGWRVIIEKWEHYDSNGNGTLDKWRFDSTQVDEDNCQSATCTITAASNISGAPPGSVQANNGFTAYATISSTGYLPLKDNYGLAMVGTAGPWNGVVVGTSVAGRYLVTIPLTAPNDRANHILQMEPQYHGKFALGGPCTTGVNTYQRFDFDGTVKATLNDNESPTEVRYESSILQRGVDVDDVSARYFAKRRGGVNLPVAGCNALADGRNFGTVNYDNVCGVPPGSYTLGDEYCMAIQMARGHGWRGPGPSTYIVEAPLIVNNCDDICPPGSVCGPPPTIEHKPYIKAYGADVVAGGGFGTSCSDTNSRILAFLRPLSEHDTGPNKSGSGGQLAAMALGDIRGFTSASSRSSPPVTSKGLTFAHDNSSPDTGSDYPVLGGNVSGNGWCAPDYYESTQFPDAAGKKDVTQNNFSAINVQAQADGRQTVRQNNGSSTKVNIGGSAGPSYNKRHTVYVDGDVYIENNIMYNTNYTAGIDVIPSFTLVVKGNIYINKDVTQLDGFYVAQPDPDRGNTGRIYTCANSAGAITSGGSMYNECGANYPSGTDRCTPTSGAKQLIVNGSFVAQKLILNRSGYTIGCSKFRETAADNKAAEIFNFSPEAYLSPPVFRPSGTSTSGDYDYITIMAPIL